MSDLLLVLRAVIESPPGVLLLQRNNKDRYAPGTWEFPGGKFESGSLEKNLRREVKEETGLAGISFGGMKCVRVTAKQSVLAEYQGKVIVTLYIYGSKNKNYKVRLSREHQNFKWIRDLREAKALPLKEEVLEILQGILLDIT